MSIGCIILFAGSTIPTGWLKCEGQSLLRTEYSDLFGVINTIYGNVDSTHFNLPNYKGRVPVGLDSSDTDFDTLGETGGSKTHTIGLANLPGGLVGASTQNTEWNCGKWGANSGYIFTTINDQNNTDTHGANSNPISNLQPYIVVNYIIKAKNTTPTMASIVDAYSTSTTDGYSANYVNGELSDLNTLINTKQNKLKTKSMTLTTDSAGNQTLGMWTQDTLVLSVYQKSGTAINGWCTLYTYNGQYMVHTGNFNGTAISGTQEFEVVYIDR